MSQCIFSHFLSSLFLPHPSLTLPLILWPSPSSHWTPLMEVQVNPPLANPGHLKDFIFYGVCLYYIYHLMDWHSFLIKLMSHH